MSLVISSSRYVLWSNTGTVTVTDSRGNAYASAGAVARWNGGSSSAQVFYARNIASGSNSVTATFGQALTSFGILYIHEYRNIDKVSPLDGSHAASGTGAVMNSGSITTTGANDLIFAAGGSTAAVNASDQSFTTRSSGWDNLTADKNVQSAGSYSATAGQNGHAWVMQIAAFQINTSTADTTAPSTPGNLATHPVSTSQVNLSWTSSNDNVGVAGYRVFRNGAQIGGSNSTAYSDVGLTPGTTYSYTVSAYDAAGNTSPQTSPVTGTTQASQSDTTPPTVPTGLRVSSTTSSSVGLAWAASTDNISVAGYRVSRDGQLVATATTTNFTDPNRAANTTYSYTVAAVDGAGNSSAQSAPVSARTLAVGSISAPLRQSSANPHYFVDGNGKAVLLTGSHTWNDFQDWGTGGSTRAFDFSAYVNMMVAAHQNFTFVWTTELPHFCNLPTTSGSPPQFDVTPLPWQRTGPGLASDGKAKFDLSKFDQSFFDRLRARVQQLNAAGIYAGVYPFTGEWLSVFRCANDGFPLTGGNNINGVDAGTGAGAVTMSAPNAVTAAQDAYVEKLVDTLNDLPNVLWATSEEAQGAGWWNSRQISHIRSYEASKPLQHPIGYGVDIAAGNQGLLQSNADWVGPDTRLSSPTTCGSGTPACKVNINDSDHTYWGLWNDSVQAHRSYVWANFTRGSQVVFMDPYVVYYPRRAATFVPLLSTASARPRTVDTTT